jgi:hypothetical protein
MLPDVIDAVDARRIREEARLLIEQKRVVFEAVPKGLRNVEELLRAFIPRSMLDVGVAPEVHRFFVHAGRHDIPAHVAVADVIERRECASDVVRLAV